MFDFGAPRLRRSATPMPWPRALMAWAVMALAMTFNGMFRVIVLAPSWGETAAGIASAISGIVLIQLISGVALGSEPTLSPGRRIDIASLWLLLTVTFEFTIGHFVAGRSWAELIANYNLLQGKLWPVVLASLVFAPFIWGWPAATRRA